MELKLWMSLQGEIVIPFSGTDTYVSETVTIDAIFLFFAPPPFILKKRGHIVGQWVGLYT